MSVSVNVVIKSARDVEMLLQEQAEDAVGAGIFAEARWLVEVEKMPSLGAAARVTDLLLEWKAKFKNQISSITIDSLKTLRAANNTTKSLRKAAMKIEKAQGKLSADERKRLKKISKSLVESSNRLPLPVKREVEIVCEDLKNAAAGTAAKKSLKQTVARIHRVVNQIAFDPSG